MRKVKEMVNIMLSDDHRCLNKLTNSTRLSRTISLSTIINVTHVFIQQLIHCYTVSVSFPE